jgi:hypothetical protein
MPTGTCPYCKQPINLVAERGQEVRCPLCQQPLRVVTKPPPPLIAPSVAPQPDVATFSKRRSRPWYLSWWVTPLACGVVLLLIMGLAVLPLFTGARSSVGLVSSPAVDPDLAAVRAYLKENTNTGKWEEVRWWPAREGRKTLQTKDRASVCRLKYRETGPFGKSLSDQIFTIENGKAEPNQRCLQLQHVYSYSTAEVWETWYPDDPK